VGTTTDAATNGVPLFERRVRVIADTLEIEGLRAQFKVKKTLRKQPNTCEISISNLNEHSRAGLQKRRRIPVILEAGYVGNLAQIFSGESRFVDQVHEGAEWVTKIQCGDGERAFVYRRVADSFRPGTRVADVINTVVGALGMTATGHLAEIKALAEQFVGGYSAFGKASSELDHLLKSRGFEWSIQDGQLQILKVGKTSNESVLVLSPSTGLVGSPEHGNPEKDVPLDQLSGKEADGSFALSAKGVKGPAVLKVKSLLQPGLRPGRKVKVESRGINGFFRIQSVEHTGDTHGGDWYSLCECLPTT
jgi:hypothetical protein